ncbi:hypothetical protein [Bradyrhizobium sp. Ash2021]|uniref:antitoxin VbhA family protein n=1 Tax=Bradyrhizobium sp. Ash2021 TaxID=2954771 RepID=UPI002815D7BE|nr:hypothetical protein [Bradyrhizobium sp. Ash2021]WMT76526.1 hypothetical protein NL528_09255 [Bradyrhizobium sp. Ash2021]
MNKSGPPLDGAQNRLAVDASALDLDRISRANSVKNAVAITLMEGGQLSPYCLEQLALFESGEISASEMRDRVIRNARG